MDINFDSMDAIPTIPNRGVSWKKVWTLIALVVTGTGTTIGTSTWAGIENTSKNAVLVQNIDLKNQKANLEDQIEKNEGEWKKQVLSKHKIAQELYTNNPEKREKEIYQYINNLKKSIYVKR